MRNLQEGLMEQWLDRSIPEGWHTLEMAHDAPREKVTLYLDREMMRWFRSLGQGYSQRINEILRIYWRGLITGSILSHWEPSVYGPQEERYIESLIAVRLAEVRAAGDQPEVVKILERVQTEVREAHKTAAQYSGGPRDDIGPGSPGHDEAG
ncbi:MAG: BrnA antitoxin family protein [Pseudomonadota bacterium]